MRGEIGVKTSQTAGVKTILGTECSGFCRNTTPQSQPPFIYFTYNAIQIVLETHNEASIHHRCSR